MRSMMRKTTFREIRQSFGRYFAILAIIALGVGFFAGLKVTKPMMLASAGDYLTQNQFYDYRLLSTLGFEEEDVEALAAKEDVRAAQGAVSVDILFQNAAGNESVIKAHSLTDRINGLHLVAGRMPERGNECVVDSLLYQESAIGSTVVLSENNTEEDLENFAYREYVITGIVESSYYIQFERGNTSLGNGMVSGYMYLPLEGFQTDYYTEIFVKFDEDFPLYSDEYQDFLEEKEPLWEAYCEEQGERRYQEILAEANDELADAERELEEKKADAQKELDDAKKELEDARAEIEDGEKSIEEGWDELAEAERTLSQKETELAEAEEAVARMEAELANGEAALAGQAALLGENGEAQLAQARMELEAAKAQLEAARAQTEEGNLKLAESRNELAEAEKTLKEKEQELEEAKAEWADGQREYEEALAEYEEETADAEREIEDARQEIADIARPDTYVLGRNTNIGYVCLESDASIVAGIANVFPIFFFLVAALVCVTTMNRMVEEQRTQIGVLKALGYGEGAIMGKYLFYSGSAALTGCVGGFFLGTWLFPQVIWIAYRMMYRMGSLQYLFDWKMALVSLIAAMACSMGATWLSIRYEMREAAAMLMRPKSPKAGKRVFLERVPFLWKRLNFLQKVSVRNIVRYKKRFFMMVIGISGCTALLVTGFGVKDSVTNIAERQFDEIHLYDLNIVLKDGTGEERTEELRRILAEDYAGESQTAMETTMDLVTKEQVKAVNIIVAKEPGEIGAFIDLHTGEKEPLSYPGPGEAVITDKISETYGLKVGDTVTLRDENMKEIHATVSGICENYIYNYVYLNPATYEEAMGRPDCRNLYVKLPEEADPHETAAAVMQEENVTSVTVTQDIRVRISSMMGSMNYIVLLVIASAAALAFIVLYNLSNINITERIREIATIKVLGFFRKETASYVFRENIVLTAIGCGLGMILGKLLHLYVMHEINIDMVSFDIHVSAAGYLLSIFLTFAFTWGVNLIMSGKLEKINMAESLKSVD